MGALSLTVYKIIKCASLNCEETKDLSHVSFHRDDGMTDNEVLCPACVKIARNNLLNPRWVSKENHEENL